MADSLTNPLLDQLRQNVSETEARLKEQEASMATTQKNLQSMISTPVPGLDEAFRQNPMLAAVHGRAARVSAAETGDLGTFNQFFRERVSSRDILADFFGGMGASMLGQQSLSLRDQKLQEYQLEKQDQARKQKAAQLHQEAFQKDLDRRLKVAIEVSESMREKAASTRLDLMTRRTKLAEEEKAQKTAEEVKAAEIKDRAYAFQNTYINSLPDPVKELGAQMAIARLESGDNGILSQEQMDELDIAAEGFRADEKKAKSLQEKAGLSDSEMDNTLWYAGKNGLEAAVTGMKAEERSAFFAKIKNSGATVPLNKKAPEQIDNLLNVVGSSQVMMDLYSDAQGFKGKTIDEISDEEMLGSGFNSKLSSFVQVLKSAYGDDSAAAVTVLEGMGFDNARKLLAAGGEQRYTDPDVLQAMKRVVTIWRTPAEVNLLVDLNKREGIKSAYETFQTQYITPEIRTLLSYPEYLDRLTVADGTNMRTKMQALFTMGIGLDLTKKRPSMPDRRNLLK